MMWGHDGFGFGYGGGWMGIGMLLFWGVVILAVVMLARGFGGSSGSGPRLPAERSKTPLEILPERYASGEIDQAEFAQKRSDLGV